MGIKIFSYRLPPEKHIHKCGKKPKVIWVDNYRRQVIVNNCKYFNKENSNNEKN